MMGALLIRGGRDGKGTVYCKPFSRSVGSDEDVDFMSQELLRGRDAFGTLLPWQMCEIETTDFAQFNAICQKLKKTIAGSEAASSRVLLEGPDLFRANGEESTAAFEMSSLLNSRVLYLIKYTNSLNANTVANVCGRFGNRLAGVIINDVPIYRRREINDGLLDSLRLRQIPVVGAIPQDRAMLAVKVSDIANYLKGSWVQTPPVREIFVDRFLIGGNIMDSGMTYFGRFDNHAVIVRADRPDILLASLFAGTKFLLLTGGSEVTEYVKAEALKREVPLLLVEQDTHVTAETIGRLVERTAAHSRQKLDRFVQLVDEHLDTLLLDALMT
jgi:BioD-like phosphotransacetylase family protein